MNYSVTIDSKGRTLIYANPSNVQYCIIEKIDETDDELLIACPRNDEHRKELNRLRIIISELGPAEGITHGIKLAFTNTIHTPPRPATKQQKT